MNVPKLRFKEFKNDWSPKNLSEVVAFSKGNSLSKSDLDEQGSYPCILYGELYTKYHEVIRKVFSKTNYISDNIVKSKYGDILIPASGETPIDISTSSCILLDNVLLGGDINILSPKNCDGRFISYMISNNKRKTIARVAQGHSIVHLYSENLKKVNLDIPLLSEQKKIADMLELLDKKIELQTKKIEALKLFKSSQICTILNKLEHKNVLLKNLGYFISGNPIGKDKITDKGTPVILYGDLYTKYEEEINDVNQYVKENKKYIKSEKGDLIFPTSTTVDAISLISPSVINISDVVYGGDLIVFKVNKAIVNPKFLSYQINHLKKKEFSKKAQGSTIIHIHADDLLNSTVEIPIMKYQNIISNFGSEINKKIELEKNKLDKLKLLKIGLLQNMFI